MKNHDDGPADEAPGFLGRWSRRKSAERRGGAPVDERPAAESEAPPAPAGPGAPADAPLQPAASEAGVEAPAEAPRAPLPALDQLGFDSDYSGFMSPEVDEALRRTALRKLFHSPELNVVDGLDDYAEDYTNFAPLGDMVTADMRFQAKRAAERAAREEAALAEQQAATESLAGDGEAPDAPSLEEPGERPAEALAEQAGESPAASDEDAAGAAAEAGDQADAPRAAGDEVDDGAARRG